MNATAPGSRDLEVRLPFALALALVALAIIGLGAWGWERQRASNRRESAARTALEITLARGQDSLDSGIARLERRASSFAVSLDAALRDADADAPAQLLAAQHQTLEGGLRAAERNLERWEDDLGRRLETALAAGVRDAEWEAVAAASARLQHRLEELRDRMDTAVFSLAALDMRTREQAKARDLEQQQQERERAQQAREDKRSRTDVELAMLAAQTELARQQAAALQAERDSLRREQSSDYAAAVARAVLTPATAAPAPPPEPRVTIIPFPSSYHGRPGFRTAGHGIANYSLPCAAPSAYVPFRGYGNSSLYGGRIGTFSPRFTTHAYGGFRHGVSATFQSTSLCLR